MLLRSYCFCLRLYVTSVGLVFIFVPHRHISNNYTKPFSKYESIKLYMYSSYCIDNNDK